MLSILATHVLRSLGNIFCEKENALVEALCFYNRSLVLVDGPFLEINLACAKLCCDLARVSAWLGDRKEAEKHVKSVAVSISAIFGQYENEKVFRMEIWSNKHFHEISFHCIYLP